MTCKEVKKIEDKKSVRLYMFAFVLMLMLLFSSTVGIIAAKPSEPPGKPGNAGPKPPPPLPKYWFYISIGQEGDDVFLKNAPLTAISYIDTCGWNWPPKKGTKSGGWSADPYEYVDPNVGCGTYNININAIPYLPVLNIEAQSYYVRHHWSYQRIRGDFGNQPIDFWEFSILWGVEIKDGVWDYDDAWRLHIWTDWGPELEGDYYPEGQVEVWTVDFNGASWELIDYENMEGGGGIGHVELGGTIVNGFNATIVKGDLVP